MIGVKMEIVVALLMSLVISSFVLVMTGLVLWAISLYKDFKYMRENPVPAEINYTPYIPFLDDPNYWDDMNKLSASITEKYNLIKNGESD